MIKGQRYISFQQIARALLPGILFFLSACHNDPNEIRALTGAPAHHEDKAEDVTIIYSEKGNVKSRIFAKEFIRNDKAIPPYEELRNGVKVEYYNDSGALTTTLTAMHAWYYEKQQNVLVRDSVVVINNKGDTLKTPELVWNQTGHKIFTEKPVRIITPTQTLFGDGLESNEDFTFYHIKNFKGSVQVQKSEVPGQ